VYENVGRLIGGFVLMMSLLLRVNQIMRVVDFQYLLNSTLLFFWLMLRDYLVKRACDFLELGFPLGFVNVGHELSQVKPKNHSSARNVSAYMVKYLEKEASYGAIVGPFVSSKCSFS
jgi:hypothetical protein